MRSVAHEGDFSLTDDVREGGPTTVGVELLLRRKQDVVADDARVHSFIFAVKVLATKRPDQQETNIIRVAAQFQYNFKEKVSYLSVPFSCVTRNWTGVNFSLKSSLSYFIRNSCLSLLLTSACFCTF